MSEFSDWGGMGFTTGDETLPETGPAGAGGDPYGGGDWSGVGDMDYTEAESTGTLPGGADGQLSPFSPNGGFDFTDILRGGAPARLARGLVGPGGIVYDTSGSVPNLGVGPMVRARSAGVPVGALDATTSAGDIVRWVRQSTGLRVTARSIVNLIVRYGFTATAAMTKLDFGSLLKLFMRQKGVTHHRRGPGIYTLARKFRKYEQLKATVSRILGRGGVHHHRRPRGRFHTMRRRSRRHAR